MSRFLLPKKISNWTILKLSAFSIFLFLGLYFYYFPIGSKLTSDNNGEVLQYSTSGVNPIYQINNYVMKDVIKPTCDKVQPYMDFFCRRTEIVSSATKTTRTPTFGVTDSNKFNNYLLTSSQNLNVTVQDSGIEMYKNPVLEEVAGVPILAYYGGIYEVVLDANPQKIVNITRTFRTSGNVGYTAGCNSSWFPSNVGKKDNTIVFGSGGLEGLLENRCYQQQKISNGYDTGWGTTVRGDRDCKPRADALGIQTIPNCKPTATVSCWDKRYQCKTLNGFTQYYNIPFLSILEFSRKAPDTDGSVLYVSRTSGMKVVPSSGGSATGDAYSYCFGKTKNNCMDPKVELAYGPNSSYVLKCGVNGCNDYGTSMPPRYGIPVDSQRKTFYERVYSRRGENKVWQDSSDLGAVWGGYDSTQVAYTAQNRVDSFRIAKFSRGGSNYLKYRLNPTLYDGMVVSPAPYLLGWDRYFPSVIDVNTGTLQDFVSDKYYFSLQYVGNKLIFTRFMVTGYCGNWWDNPSAEMKRHHCYPKNGAAPYNPTTFSSIELPNVNLSYTKNVTFSINSAEDIDIMIAPNLKDSMENPNASTRMFRAKNFNSPTGFYSLYELTPSNGGYQFLNPGPGNNAPLTFRYYNNTDTDTSNDYAVFVSRNYVFSTKMPLYVPTTPSPTEPPICIPNYLLPGGGLSLNNTNPQSLNKGIVPSDSESPTIFDLKFSFNQAVTMSCPSRTTVTTLPSGTDFEVTLYDGVSSQPFADKFVTNLEDDRKSLNFQDVESPNFRKLFYSLSFDFEGRKYSYPQNLDSQRYFTLESYLTVNAFFDNQDTDPLDSPKFSITKKYNSRDYFIDNLSSPLNDFVLSSGEYPNLFWDHDMNNSGSGLLDKFTYRLCMKNTADMQISKIAFTNQPSTLSSNTISNNFLSATKSGNCLDINYKSIDRPFYKLVPQSIDIYVSTSSISAPTSYVNFIVNGNTMIKNNPVVKFFTTSVQADRKYEGVYVSSVDNGKKSYKGSATLFDNYFKLPYVSNLSKGVNLTFTNNLTTFESSASELSNFILVSNKNSNTGSALESVDVLTNLVPSVDPTVVYVAKNKKLLFDLKDVNLNSLDNVYFVSVDLDDPKQKISFKVDCSDPLGSYSMICNQNMSFNLKGGIYGDMKLEGILNTQNVGRSFINITHNPAILLDLQLKLRNYKIFNIGRSKTVFKYLNN